MGTDYALACGDCLEFIDLHKWSIVECSSLLPRKIPSLSNQLIFPVNTSKILKSLNNLITSQSYIQALFPSVRDFITCHYHHTIFLTWDVGEYPWEFGEPQYLEWKEIQSGCSYYAQFLPRNLIEDYGFRCWEEVLLYYSKYQPWFLHEQLKQQREALKTAFEQKLFTTYTKSINVCDT